MIARVIGGKVPLTTWRGDAVATQSDLYRRAEECVRLMDVATDPSKKESFGLLRDMWIMLAQEYPDLPGDVIAEDIAAMDVIQRLLGDSENGSNHQV